MLTINPTSLAALDIPSGFVMTGRFAAFLLGSGAAFFALGAIAQAHDPGAPLLRGRQIHQLESKWNFVPAPGLLQWAVLAIPVLLVGNYVSNVAGRDGVVRYTLALPWAWYIWSIRWKFLVRREAYLVAAEYKPQADSQVGAIAFRSYWICLLITPIVGAFSI
ncbi:hypothetical protein [Planctomycetes bacterium Pla163]